MPIIKYENVDIHINSKIILEDVTFTLNAGDFAYATCYVGEIAGIYPKCRRFRLHNR